MSHFIQDFILTFVPLFIVIDALGNVPFVITMCEGMCQGDRLKVVHVATGTATAVGLAFLFFGHLILRLLGISVGSFAIAGGLILLILSIKYTMTGRMVELIKEEMVAVVPIGTPLTVGPATITTLLLLINQFSLYVVLFSFILNMIITWFIMLLSSQIYAFMGRGGLTAVSRVFSLLLAAIAVTMILQGLNMLHILNIQI